MLIYKLVHWAVSAMALIMTSALVKGFKIGGFLSAMITALVIAMADLLVWPVLIILTLPLNVLTLGLFTFVVNGMVLKLCAALVPGFELRSWWAAIFGSVVLSMISTALHYILV